jgi:hypothetical protein
MVNQIKRNAGLCPLWPVCIIPPAQPIRDTEPDSALALAPSALHRRAMTKYLISFPSEAMVVSAEELSAVGADARAVIEEAKSAGVYVFAGGINEAVAPVLIGMDGSVSGETHPGSRIVGGFAVLELPTREDAVAWARKLAIACRCAQELREFGYDPAS